MGLIKGVITMNEMTRIELMKRIQERRDAMKKVTSLHYPRIIKKLEKFKQLSWFYNKTWIGGDKYQVVGLDGQFVVDKKECNCSCRRWQSSGVLCSHAISMLYYNKEKPKSYLDACYNVNTSMETYRPILNPTHDKGSWPKADQGPIIPPEPVNNKWGRKTMLRSKEVGENIGFTGGKVGKKGVRMTCNLCGAAGHNKSYYGVQVSDVKYICVTVCSCCLIYFPCMSEKQR